MATKHYMADEQFIAGHLHLEIQNSTTKINTPVGVKICKNESRGC